MDRSVVHKLIGIIIALAASWANLPASAEYFAADNQDQEAPHGHQDTGGFISWPVAGQPSAILLLIHGFGLHKGTFDAFGKRMAANGIAAYAIDAKGFGTWAQARGHKDLDFDATLIETGAILMSLRRNNPGVPIFLLGESMGGAIALQVTALYPQYVDGLIAAAPSADYYGENSQRVHVALHMLHPGERFAIGKDVVNRATVKESLKASWQNDPQARLDLSPQEMLRFRLFMMKNKQMARKIKDKPVLVIQGNEDKLAKPDGTVKVFKALNTKDKDLILVGKAEHLIFEEGQFDEHMLGVVTSWIAKHQKPSPTDMHKAESRTSNL